MEAAGLADCRHDADTLGRFKELEVLREVTPNPYEKGCHETLPSA